MNLWLLNAQVTNDLDEALYSHGVFELDPADGAAPAPTETTSPAPTAEPGARTGAGRRAACDVDATRVPHLP